MNTDDKGNELPNTVYAGNDTCPTCGNTEMKMLNYNPLFREGEVHCARCGTFVRYFNAG